MISIVKSRSASFDGLLLLCAAYSGRGCCPAADLGGTGLFTINLQNVKQNDRLLPTRSSASAVATDSNIDIASGETDPKLSVVTIVLTTDANGAAAADGSGSVQGVSTGGYYINSGVVGAAMGQKVVAGQVSPREDGWINSSTVPFASTNQAVFVLLATDGFWDKTSPRCAVRNVSLRFLHWQSVPFRAGC